MTNTPCDLDEVRKEHFCVPMADAGGQDYCNKCLGIWPCTTIHLADELAEARAEIEGLRTLVRGGNCIRDEDDEAPCERLLAQIRREQEKNAPLLEALGAQKKYIEFLEEACERSESFCAVHGITISAEDFERGEQLRAKIARVAMDAK